VLVLNVLPLWHNNCSIIIVRKLQDIETEFNFFGNLWRDFKPIVKLFRTRAKGYLYDTGTNKIVACSESEYDFIYRLLSMDLSEAFRSMTDKYSWQEMVSVAKNIKKAIKKENILLTRRATQFGRSSHFGRDLVDLIEKFLGMIQLDITERCNLRCEYCIYSPRVKSKRNHGNINMSRRIAYRGIDYLAEHSSARDEVSISFYGGEPLLSFNTIRACVEYAKNRIIDKKLGFSLTTNGLLITYEMARYFYHNNFGIVVSIDGPENIHDYYRKDRAGNGSYRRAIRGLKILIDVFRKDLKRISLSMVYAPPYSEQKMDLIADLWKDIPELYNDVYVLITYPHQDSIPINKADIEDRLDLSLESWTKARFINNYLDGNNNILDPISRSLFERRLALLMKRPTYDMPTDTYLLNGCCIPAERKLFVTASGQYHLCERISDYAPSIGDVYSGININRIKDIFIDQYSTRSISMCADCWLIQLCPVCYASAFENKEFDIEIKKRACRLARYSKEADLVLYCELMEINNKGLDYLSQWTFS